MSVWGFLFVCLFCLFVFYVYLFVSFRTTCGPCQKAPVQTSHLIWVSPLFGQMWHVPIHNLWLCVSLYFVHVDRDLIIITRNHVSPLLRTLHWLPIQARIEFKLSTLCHSFFFDTAPVYLSDLLLVYSLSRQLRSPSDSGTLRILHIKTKTFGHRSLFLPRLIQSTTAFKTALKTHLFKSYLY